MTLLNKELDLVKSLSSTLSSFKGDISSVHSNTVEVSKGLGVCPTLTPLDCNKRYDLLQL